MIWAKQHQNPCVPVFLDLDHFKQIYHQYGHLVGGLVLEQFAQTVRSLLGPDDCQGRLGGEEFVARDLSEAQTGAE